MNRKLRFIFAVVVLGVLAAPAQATYNAAITGTVAYVQQNSTSMSYTAETTSFALVNQPSNSCGVQQFVISPTTVTDAQTRRNMIAILLAAKAAGTEVSVAYDNAGGFCDQGMVGVYYIVMR